jgi:hypothetical protein
MTIVNPSDDGRPCAVQYTQSLLKEHPPSRDHQSRDGGGTAAAQVVKQQACETST